MPDDAPFPIMSDADVPDATSHSEDAADSTPSSLFSAIREQLGLKLETGKISADVTAVDTSILLRLTDEGAKLRDLGCSGWITAKPGIARREAGDRRNLSVDEVADVA